MTQFNRKLFSRRALLKSLYLTALLVIVLSSFAYRAKADVPDVLQIENNSQGSRGRIKVTIRHASPTLSHYVYEVSVDVNGKVTKFQQQPQTSDTFTVELDLGEIQGTPSVKAKASCNLHGDDGWSNPIVIPEFPAVAMTLFLALAASLVMIKKTKKN